MDDDEKNMAIPIVVSKAGESSFSVEELGGRFVSGHEPIAKPKTEASEEKRGERRAPSATGSKVAQHQRAAEYHPRNVPQNYVSSRAAGSVLLCLDGSLPFLRLEPGFEAPQTLVRHGGEEVIISCLGYAPHVALNGRTIFVGLKKVERENNSWSSGSERLALLIDIPRFAVHFQTFATETALKIVFYRGQNITPPTYADDFAPIKLN